jgi:triacylglycerol lipase
MTKINSFFLLIILIAIAACNTAPKKPTEYTSTKEVLQLNQIIYKDSISQILPKVASQYKVVWEPNAINGNYAVVFKHQKNEQYCVVIRGSLIEFSKEGFQNWILQDFNIFNLKAWKYTDTVKRAYVSNGSSIGFDNLQQLQDISTQKTLEQFIKTIPSSASLTITGHSLGGNLAQIYASYLWQQLSKTQRAQTTIVTFGATAVGNQFFVQDLEEKFPNAMRYEIDKDIAPKFPSLDKVSNITSSLGLDSILGVAGLAGEKAVLTKVFTILSEGAKSLNLINEENSYAQCMKHQQIITIPKTDSIAPSGNTVLNLFEDIYQYHKIDQYAKQFGVSPIDSVLKL